jgi:hypothetical protein
MIQQTPRADLFKQRLRDSLQRETLNTRAVKIARHTNVYKLRRSRRNGLLHRERPNQTAHAVLRR